MLVLSCEQWETYLEMNTITWNKCLLLNYLLNLKTSFAFFFLICLLLVKQHKTLNVFQVPYKGLLFAPSVYDYYS